MREEYPFFREEDERTRAVIGEEAAASDLEGTYQRPYAILTQKRLYCKNERGNFITDAATLRSAGKGLLPGQNWFLWAAAACAALALILLGLWYWGLGGRWYVEDISYSAQQYIDYYLATEEKLPEYKQRVEDYETTQREIEKLRLELEVLNPARVRQETNQVFWEADGLRSNLDRATAERDYYQEYVDTFEDNITEFTIAIEEAQQAIADAGGEPGSDLAEQIRILEDEYYSWGDWAYAENNAFADFMAISDSGQYVLYHFKGMEFLDIADIRAYCRDKMQELSAELTRLRNSYADVDYLQEIIKRNQRNIAETKSYLAEYRQYLNEAQQWVDDAQAEVDSFRPTLTKAEDRLGEVTARENQIAQKESTLDERDLAMLQNEIQRFENGKDSYKAAESVQQKVGMFMPCLLLLAVCVMALALLTGLKRTKPAVIAAVVSACAGLVCVSLATPSAGVWMYEYYGSMAPAMAIPLRILPALAILLGLAALVWDKKRTVFQIVHATGAFSFAPGAYPAGELKVFEEQVKALKAGGANGQ